MKQVRRSFWYHSNRSYVTYRNVIQRMGRCAKHVKILDVDIIHRKRWQCHQLCREPSLFGRGRDRTVAMLVSETAVDKINVYPWLRVPPFSPLVIIQTRQIKDNLNYCRVQGWSVLQRMKKWMWTCARLVYDDYQMVVLAVMKVGIRVSSPL